jgi:hypothetical protein
MGVAPRPLADRLAAVAGRSTCRLTHRGRTSGKAYDVTIPPGRASERRKLAGEGEPMPLQPKRLPDAAIRLVSEWIAAGAPATGFVAPSGCPGP